MSTSMRTQMPEIWYLHYWNKKDLRDHLHFKFCLRIWRRVEPYQWNLFLTSKSCTKLSICSNGLVVLFGISQKKTKETFQSGVSNENHHQTMSEGPSWTTASMQWLDFHFNLWCSLPGYSKPCHFFDLLILSASSLISSFSLKIKIKRGKFTLAFMILKSWR